MKHLAPKPCGLNAACWVKHAADRCGPVRTLTRAARRCQTGHERNIAHSTGQENPVQIRLIAADPDSQPTNSPTLYRTDRGSWIVQGWVVTDPEVLAQMGIPQGETCVEIPDRMIPFFAEGEG
jgi:hypothetical protein